MIYTRSQAAFTLSALKLFDEHPRVYFWTFTMTKCVADWRAMQAWMYGWQRVYDWYGTYVFGLRVVEAHKKHGLHFHMLQAGLRMSVHVVRKAMKPFGFGRIHVVKADRGSILYLCKYLTKDNDLLKGARSWASVGGFGHCPVRNVEMDSMFHRNLKRLSGGKRVHYLYARDVYKETQLWGDCRNWQKSKQQSKREYYLAPHLSYGNRTNHKPELCPRFFKTYPPSILWPVKHKG